MRIAYYAKANPGSDKTEEHILKALVELGYDAYMAEIDTEIEADVILFHKSLPKGKGLKVCWYFDKIYTDLRRQYIKKVLEEADFLFVSDETWARENPHPKVRILRQGVGDFSEGKRVVTNIQVAFTGSLYGTRYDWAAQLAKQYGDKFQIFTNTFNENLNNLCTSVPIFIAPIDPGDDYYWSSRVYITIGSGGFMIHPRFKRLEEEYVEDKEIVFYDSLEDLYKKIDYYLAHPVEREKIRLAGWEKTKNSYTYKHRICTLVSTLQKK